MTIMAAAPPPLHIAWNGVSFTLHECQLACALNIYLQFEDGTPLDEKIIGEIIGAFSGLQNMNCAGLVDHLRVTNNVYPDVLADGDHNMFATWARDAWNKWQDPAAAPVGMWP